MKPELEVKKSRVHGQGIFAMEGLPKGSVVDRIAGTPQHYSSIPVALLLRRSFEVSKDNYVVAMKGSVGWFLNHSDRPNCTYDISTREITTTRKIRKGEELTLDYHETTTWPGYAALWKGDKPP
jgi:SET domain-containing protein